jgi:hypothetical protein
MSMYKKAPTYVEAYLHHLTIIMVPEAGLALARLAFNKSARFVLSLPLNTQIRDAKKPQLLLRLFTLSNDNNGTRGRT